MYNKKTSMYAQYKTIDQHRSFFHKIMIYVKQIL